MPFIPHTREDVKVMLECIGVEDIDQLYDEIPDELKLKSLSDVPMGMSEMEVSQWLKQLAAKNQAGANFIGAGAYEHYIPAAVFDLLSRGEFYTSYTPYQAEASQGNLQLIYEYQTMMANLTGMEVSNASLYDGATALAEAVLMAVRCNRQSQSKRILMPATVHPAYRQVVANIVKQQQVVIEEVPYCTEGGNVIPEALTGWQGEDIAALVIPQPNFFGVLEEVDALTDWAHQHNILVIAVVNPLSLALLKEPGKWGQAGADIVCGDGQSLGVPLACGGPYFGFLCCRKAIVRQLPGRIVGRTVDEQGKTCFTLTLQAREQHIRRSKATSNICTNQGLMVTAATIYMSLLGAEGLKQVAATCHHRAREFMQQLMAIEGVTRVFQRPFFHEFVLRLEKPVAEVITKLAGQGIFAGYNLQSDYPELGDCLLVCVTETKSDAELQRYHLNLQQALSKLSKTQGTHK